MRTYTTILFDLDGTLTDPQIGITRSVQYALRHYAIEIEDLNTLLPFIGPPLHESFQRYFHFDEQTSKEAVRYYREYFSETGIFENSLYPGIGAMLEGLSRHAVIYMATSKPTIFAAKIAGHFQIAPYFKAIAGSNLDGSRTNKAEVIRHVVEQHALDVHQCIMVGDREHDVIGAKTNAMDSVGVLYGFGSREEINSIDPTYVVATVAELHQHLLSTMEAKPLQ